MKKFSSALAVRPGSERPCHGADDIKQKKLVNAGLNQGNPAPPVLYNNMSNVLIRLVLHTLRMVDEGDLSAPLNALADEIVLQPASDVAAERSLRAAGGWAADLLMRFNMELGKSLDLIKHGNRKLCNVF